MLLSTPPTIPNSWMGTSRGPTNPVRYLLVLGGILGGLLCCIDPLYGQQVAGEKPIRNAAAEVQKLWESEIRPILAKHCLDCHNGIERSGRLEMETILGLYRGGISGSAVDHANPKSSLILEVVAPQAKRHMPPEGQLTESEIQQLSQWLDRVSKETELQTWLPAKEKGSGGGESKTSEHADKGPWSLLPLGLNPSQVIDLSLEQGWNANRLIPARLSEDATFIRRLYLDLVGRVPRDSERRMFLDSTESQKREKWIDILLASEEHATHMAEILDSVLIGRKDVAQTEKRKKSGWNDFLYESIRENRPWNQTAREILLARPESPESNGAVWYLYSRQNKHQDIAEAVSKDFFGVRIDCAQCHDHPLASEIEQRHYWGLVAFFNRSKNVDSPKGPRVAEVAIGGFSEFTNLRGKSSPNQLVFLKTEPIEETRPEKDAKEEDRDDLYLPMVGEDPKIPKFSRRAQFVDGVLTDHPLVAKSMVNRMWGWMFGSGLVHPVDSLDSFHPASHPELLDWLSRDFAQSNYDLRRLLRSMAMSRAYQLAASSDASVDPKWFSSALAKPLTAESLYRSLQIALDLDSSKDWSSTSNRVSFANLFPDVLTEESLGSVSQGLFLTNSELIQSMVSTEHSHTIREAMKIEETNLLVDRLFTILLGRSPDESELKHCVHFLEDRIDRKQKGVEALAWSLITSAEFRFSH